MTDTGPLFVSSGDLIADRRYKWALDQAARGDFDGAADVLVQTVGLAPGFATAWFALGAIRDRLGDRGGAVAAFEQARDADPQDYHGARLQLARLGAGDATPAMSETYVRRLFDQYAARYDTALTERLAYRGPALLREAVENAMQGARRRLYFRPCSTLVAERGLGVPLFAQWWISSSASICLRRWSLRRLPKSLYDRLATADLTRFLADEAADTARYDLVLAADVFVYVSDLAPIMAGIARVLAPEGLFAFTVETHSGDEREAPADAALRPRRAVRSARAGRSRAYAGIIAKSSGTKRKGRAGRQPGRGCAGLDRAHIRPLLLARDRPRARRSPAGRFRALVRQPRLGAARASARAFGQGAGRPLGAPDRADRRRQDARGLSAEPRWN